LVFYHHCHFPILPPPRPTLSPYTTLFRSSAYPNGFWAFNPFAWQLLFVFGAWCALGGARRMSRILSSNITMWICIVYLVAAFFRSEEHTSELQSRFDSVCRHLLENKNM